MGNILGQGPIGLLMTQVAKASGCRVIAIDQKDYRLTLATKYGADVCINPKNERAIRKVKNTTQGGSDMVIEAAGRRETVEKTPSLARKAGRIALVGDFYGLMNLGNAEEATFFSATVNPNKHPLGLDLLSRKILNVKSMITYKFQLTEFEAAIEAAGDPRKKPGKVLVENRLK